MLELVAPVDHKYEEPLLEVRVTLPPWQKVVGPPDVIVGVDGKEFTVTTVEDEEALVQPLALVTCTV
jgi:hypothetical protein